MRAMLVVGLFASIVAAAFAADGPAKPKKEDAPANAVKAGVNVDLDEKSAVAIAEIVLVKVYGERVLKQRPWIVSKGDDAFKIEGTFHGGPFAVGGVAMIKIRRTNAEVIEIIHGK